MLNPDSLQRTPCRGVPFYTQHPVLCAVFPSALVCWLFHLFRLSSSADIFSFLSSSPLSPFPDRVTRSALNLQQKAPPTWKKVNLVILPVRQTDSQSVNDKWGKFFFTQEPSCPLQKQIKEGGRGSHVDVFFLAQKFSSFSGHNGCFFSASYVMAGANQGRNLSRGKSRAVFIVLPLGAPVWRGE